MPGPGTTRMFYGDYEFTPVPLLTESIEIIRDAKLDQLFSRNTKEFTGVLLENPGASGAFLSLFEKKEALLRALASGNQELIISHAGVPLVSGEFPRINGPVFEEGTWVDRVNFTFSAERDSVEEGSGIQSFTETWAFEEDDNQRSVTVQHDVNAIGINSNPSGINNAVTNARSFVLARTGYDKVPTSHPVFVQASGTISVPSNAFEALRSESIDIQAGSFGVTERFILSSGNFIHTRTAQFNIEADGVTTVSLNGNIRGLGRKGDDIAYQRALIVYDDLRPLFPADASGIYSEFSGDATLFTTNPLQNNVTKNRFLGTVDYSVSFDDSPSNNLPSGIQEFSISTQVQEPIRIFASFLIMERALGPVVQDVATSNEGSFTIQGNAVGKPSFPFNDLLAFVEDKINDNRPDPIDFITLRPGALSVTKDQENKVIQFNVQYAFTKELSQVFGDASAPVVIT